VCVAFRSRLDRGRWRRRHQRRRRCCCCFNGGVRGAKGASTRAAFYFTYPLPLIKPRYEVNLEAQALEAAQSAATHALSEGSTRLSHDTVLGTVTSHEVQRRRRREHDVTLGKLTGRRRLQRGSLPFTFHCRAFCASDSRHETFGFLSISDPQPSSVTPSIDSIDRPDPTRQPPQRYSIYTPWAGWFLSPVHHGRRAFPSGRRGETVCDGSDTSPRTRHGRPAFLGRHQRCCRCCCCHVRPRATRSWEEAPRRHRFRMVAPPPCFVGCLDVHGGEEEENDRTCRANPTTVHLQLLLACLGRPSTRGARRRVDPVDNGN
jgi:hypothetical protein